MLQTRLGISALCVFAFTMSAHAADMGRPVYKAPPAPIATFSWTGFYIGGNVGGAWGDFNNTLSAGDAFFTPPDLALINASGTFAGSPSSFTGGGQIGWNYQTGSWVWGLEADFNWLDLEADRRHSRSYSGGVGLYNVNTSLSANWLATVRGRLGYAFDRNLLYVTGGLALADLQTHQHWSDDSGAFPSSFTYSTSRIRTGWTIGGGYEFAWVPNWTTKIEYLFSRFDLDYAGTIEDEVFRNSADLDIHVLRVGLNYKFGDYGKAPVVARY